ncbi:YlaF family protein [Bacillus horti]|uniref:YlaF family protein n=1 Tax=Caldalkalibacillus horti TaxID=77523 RepID=A0ABT9W102_9BACI|nr:YlaF family protein [Bacillus horti]MDQ0166930.1 hypothetical protein [Bacillus horti]
MNRKVISLLFALAAVSCFVLAGIFVAERSVLGVILSLLASVVVMGVGFSFKKKFRLQDENRSKS